MALQRAYGNQAVAKLLQARTAHGGGQRDSATAKPMEPGTVVRPSLESRLDAQKGRGSPLPDEVRTQMEPRFGAGFGDVRLHTGTEASELSAELSARAFTHGSDIYMGQGQLNTASEDGRRLLAHELTHVVQQTGRVHESVLEPV